MILNDKQIADFARQGMINPFTPALVREMAMDAAVPGVLGRCLSYGLSSYGYDLRLSPQEFKVFRHVPGKVMNPKEFNPANLEAVELHEDEYGQFFILPGHSYGLGVAFERLELPRDVTALFIGKSTYARMGVIANLTPGEAGWQGYLTLEFSNSSAADCRIYANEGIVQAIFLQGDPCATSYGDRKGKYQNQPQRVITGRV